MSAGPQRGYSGGYGLSTGKTKDSKRATQRCPGRRTILFLRGFGLFYTVMGDEGRATINFARPSGIALYKSAYSRIHRPRDTVRLGIGCGRLSGYYTQWRTFGEAIRNKTEVCPNFSDGLAVTKAVEQLIQSTRTGTAAGAAQ